MNTAKQILLCSLIAGIGLQGCASPKTEEIKAEAQRTVDAQENQWPKAADSTNRSFVTNKIGSYFGKKMIAVPRDKLLPNVFSRPAEFKVALISTQGRVNLSALAEEVFHRTGIPVEIDQNVFLREANVPAAGAAGQTTGKGAGNNQSSANLAFEFEKSVPMNYYGPLAEYLNMVSSKLGISWEYDAGKVHFFRFKSKTFEIKAAAGKKTTSSAFDSNGSINTSGSGGGSSSSSSSSVNVGVSQRTESSMDFWTEFMAELNAMLSPGEKAVANQAAGTLTVNATPRSLERIAAFVEEQNRRVTRSVYLQLQLVSIVSKSGRDIGVDVNAFLTSQNNKYRGFVSSAASLVSKDAGTLGTTLLPPVAGSPLPGLQGDPFKNGDASVAIVQALSQWADVSIVDNIRAYATNQIPTPITMGGSKKYVESTGSTYSQNVTQTQVKQETVNFGLSMVFTPRIFDNNEMMLGYTLDLANLEGFEVTKVDNTTVKSPELRRRATSQTVKLIPGQTVALAQFTNTAAIDKINAGFGGSQSKSDGKEVLFLLATPVLVDAAR